MSKTQLSGVSGGHRSSWTWQHPHWQSHCAVLETDVVFHSNWTLWVGSRWYCLGCILYFSTLLHVCSWASFRFLHKWALPSWNQLRCSELLCTMPPSTAPWSLCNWTGWVRPHSHRAWSTVKQRPPRWLRHTARFTKNAPFEPCHHSRVTLGYKSQIQGMALPVSAPRQDLAAGPIKDQSGYCLQTFSFRISAVGLTAKWHIWTLF